MDRKVPYLRIAFYLMAALISLFALGILFTSHDRRFMGEPEQELRHREQESMRQSEERQYDQEHNRQRLEEARRQLEEARRLRILETGYSLLDGIGGEELGYGLYSYAIVVTDNDRSNIFLRELFHAIPRVEGTAARPSQTNILYVPVKDKAQLYRYIEAVGGYEHSFVSHAKDFYDYKISRTLLDHLCDPPAKEIRTVCEGDLSRGPYIFSYAKPASKVVPVPPPFLFIDLSDVHERAFPEFIAAFRAQVKREDISDRAKIDTLRLKLLSIVLTAADFVAPVQKAMADIVHIAGGRADGDKK